MTPSATDATNTPPTAAARRNAPSVGVWMVVACALLAGSGFIRVAQERRFDAAIEDAGTPPFPLKDLPRVLGVKDQWRMKGEEQVLPEETLQIAGCSDYVARTYINKQTGVTLSVLVAFGAAERVFGHSPVVCFPAFGYHLEASPERRNLKIDAPGGDRNVPTDALIYSKPNGGSDELVEVYYSFRHDGRWSPDASTTRKQFRHRPAMFKVQVERPIFPNEAGSVGGPIEEFLAAMVGEIERRLDETDGPVAVGSLAPSRTR